MAKKMILKRTLDSKSNRLIYELSFSVSKSISFSLGANKILPKNWVLKRTLNNTSNIIKHLNIKTKFLDFKINKFSLYSAMKILPKVAEGRVSVKQL